MKILLPDDNESYSQTNIQRTTQFNI